VILTCSRTFA